MKRPKHSDFEMGRSIWAEYVRVNGYAFEPKESGLKKLSRLLDLNVSYLRKMINAFLES